MVEIKDIKALIKMVEAHAIGEFVLETADEKIIIRRQVGKDVSEAVEE
jgi:hypothetical protein